MKLVKKDGKGGQREQISRSKNSKMLPVPETIIHEKIAEIRALLEKEAETMVVNEGTSSETKDNRTGKKTVPTPEAMSSYRKAVKLCKTILGEENRGDIIELRNLLVGNSDPPFIKERHLERIFCNTSHLLGSNRPPP